MAGRQASAVLQYLRNAAPPESATATDGQLLDRFVTERDEAAFTTLVHRYGPLVWGVCRRILHQASDTEDAFQATFLVLFRKASSIRKRSSVQSWLYGVAYRVAVRARATASRAPVLDNDTTARTLDDPCSEVIWRDLRGVLDEEVNQLAEKYRGPVLLCYLEGKTLAEAALVLRCPLGTVSTRLAHAREVLRGRLTRRGLTLSSGALVTLLTSNAVQAAVPTALIAMTQRAAVLSLLDPAAAIAAISPNVRALTEGVCQAMIFAKSRLVAIGLILFGIGGAVVGSVGHQSSADQNAQPAKSSPAQSDATKEGRPKDLIKLSCHYDGVILFTGTPIKQIDRETPIRIRELKVDGAVTFYRVLREGDSVEAGQVLVQFDDLLERNDLAIKARQLAAKEATRVAAQATSEEAKQQAAIAEKLWGQSKASMSSDQLRTTRLAAVRYLHEANALKEDVEVARLELKKAQLLLEMRTIRSPTRGVVKTIYFHPGEAVKKLEPVIAIKIDEREE